MGAKRREGGESSSAAVGRLGQERESAERSCSSEHGVEGRYVRNCVSTHCLTARLDGALCAPASPAPRRPRASSKHTQTLVPSLHSWPLPLPRHSFFLFFYLKSNEMLRPPSSPPPRARAARRARRPRTPCTQHTHGRPAPRVRDGARRDCTAGAERHKCAPPSKLAATHPFPRPQLALPSSPFPLLPLCVARPSSRALAAPPTIPHTPSAAASRKTRRRWELAT